MILSMFTWKVISALTILYAAFNVALNVVTIMLMLDIKGQPEEHESRVPRVNFVLAGNLTFASIWCLFLLSAAVGSPYMVKFWRFAHPNLPNLELKK